MADDNTNHAQAHHRPPEPNPALERLDALVGEWTAEATVPSDPPLAAHGRTAFERLTGLLPRSTLGCCTSRLPRWYRDHRLGRLG